MTGAVRQADSKGRHTTSFREMVPLHGGGLVIDTPGMREIQLWADEASLAQYFSDIDKLAEQCRFRDCRHQQEPGCAVQAAVADGALAPARLAHYHKLQEEVQLAEKRQSAARQKKGGRAKRPRTDS